MIPEKCTPDRCQNPPEKRGYCLRHYEYFRKRGLLPRRTKDELYEEKVDRSGGPEACHLWTAAVNKCGYGLFTHDGDTLAARWAYKRYIGPLAANEVVRHTCDTPACHNRDHWVKGTQANNVADAVSRNRQHRPRGERNIKAKLTEQQVREIRASEQRLVLLAAQYGVSKWTISQIRHGVTWKHVAA